MTIRIRFSIGQKACISLANRSVGYALLSSSFFLPSSRSAAPPIILAASDREATMQSRVQHREAGNSEEGAAQTSTLYVCIREKLFNQKDIQCGMTIDSN